MGPRWSIDRDAPPPAARKSAHRETIRERLLARTFFHLQFKTPTMRNRHQSIAFRLRRYLLGSRPRKLAALFGVALFG